jgi:hypothetical protein
MVNIIDHARDVQGCCRIDRENLGMGFRTKDQTPKERILLYRNVVCILCFACALFDSSDMRLFFADDLLFVRNAGRVVFVTF